MVKVIIKFYPMLYFDFKQRNRNIDLQLSVATMGGTYHNIVRKFKDTNVGNEAWKSMCECYDGDVIKNETKDPHIKKIKNYYLTLSSYSENDINKLLTTYR